MKVRCIKLLEGARAGGSEVNKLASLHVGGEYVVLGMSGRPIDGVHYLLLRDGSATATVAAAAEMFEIVSGTIPASWRAHDPHGTGTRILLEPEAWAERDLWDQKDRGDLEAMEIFRKEVALMYEEEGESPPT